MNQTIRKRIEDINNGIVPEGYKQTSFGIFPCDWETISLGDLLDFKNGVNADKEKYNSGVKMISVMDILTDGPIYYDKIRGQVDIDENTLNTYSVTYGDILFQRSSETFEDAGKSNVYLDCDKTATYSGFVIRGKKKAEYNPYFLNESLKISQVRKQIIRNAAGSQHINVGQESLEKIIVPSALSAEQGKIAEILMKWDEMVELQEQYIQKLELRKKAIMKKLLTPKDGWKSVKLGDMAEMYAGGTPSTKNLEYWGGDIPWIQSGLIQNNYIEIKDIDGRITEKGLKNSSTAWIEKDSVLVAITGATCANIAYLKCKATANQSVISITTNKINSCFLYFYMQNARNELLALQNGSAQGGLTLKYLQNFEIQYPENQEQEKISQILFMVDEEISLQKEKLAKIKEQRKAMQQYLLTGVVRVG